MFHGKQACTVDTNINKMNKTAMAQYRPKVKTANKQYTTIYISTVLLYLKIKLYA